MHRSAHVLARTGVPTALAALLMVFAGPFVHVAVARATRTGADQQRVAGWHQTDRVEPASARGANRAGPQHRYDGPAPAVGHAAAHAPARATRSASRATTTSAPDMSRTRTTQEGRAPPA